MGLRSYGAISTHPNSLGTRIWLAAADLLTLDRRSDLCMPTGDMIPLTRRNERSVGFRSVRRPHAARCSMFNAAA